MKIGAVEGGEEEMERRGMGRRRYT